MATLRILSAGAAQAVTERIIEAFKRDTGDEVVADFGAVGAMKARVTGGEKVDVIILTQSMIDELTNAHLIVKGSRVDLGKVGTGVAVPAGTPLRDISTADALRAALLAAHRIVYPDPAVATAGKIVMALVEKLGVKAEVEGRMQFFPNGYAAMGWLSAEGGARDVGITQVTEILPNERVSYAGPLPAEFQMKTIYSAGLAREAGAPHAARDFIARFAAPSARRLLIDAGYELEQ